MPLTYKQCDIFTSGCDILVNPVNCVGIMGKGLALQFKERYPEMFQWYKKQCDLKQVAVGKLSWFPSGPSCKDAVICCFPTKDHWRNPSKLWYIEAGLIGLKNKLEQFPHHSLCLPPIGCGLGGLSWLDVRNLIDLCLGSLPNHIIVTRNY